MKKKEWKRIAKEAQGELARCSDEIGVAWCQLLHERGALKEEIRRLDDHLKQQLQSPPDNDYPLGGLG